MPLDRGARGGRYVVGDEIASGGMATVHLGRMLGDAGFARTVAIKRLHPQYTRDPDVCAMLLDEGRLSARIHHLNVVTTLDVVASEGDLFIVMEYVHGEPLSALIRAAIRKGQKVPPRICSAVLSGALRGLHAAHEARDARGEPLGVVHRDVSPQNILVGSDGVARVLDFGIAKAAGRAQVTTDGSIKGKFGYMPPEQLHGEVLDRRADVYAAGVVLWEALVGARLFAGSGATPDFARLLDPRVDPPSSRLARLPPAYDAVVMRALAREAEGRFPTTLEMAEALEACGPVAPPAEVGAWVMDVAGDLLAELSGRVVAIETRLLSSIRESLHLLESSDAAVTHLDALPAFLASARASIAGPDGDLPAPRPTLASSVPPPPGPASAAAPLQATDSFPAVGSPALWAGAAALGGLAIAATLAIIATVPGSADPSGAAEAPSRSATGSDAPSTPATASTQPPAPTASASAKPASTARARAPVRVAAPRRPADECNPPSTIDAEGHKHYKRACLK
jgi:serine/threonine-protein kinase